jgi:hypothetical protein
VTALLVVDVEMVQNQDVADGLTLRRPFPRGSVLGRREGAAPANSRAKQRGEQKTRDHLETIMMMHRDVVIIAPPPPAAESEEDRMIIMIMTGVP